RHVKANEIAVKGCRLELQLVVEELETFQPTEMGYGRGQPGRIVDNVGNWELAQQFAVGEERDGLLLQRFLGDGSILETAFATGPLAEANHVDAIRSDRDFFAIPIDGPKRLL